MKEKENEEQVRGPQAVPCKRCGGIRGTQTQHCCCYLFDDGGLHAAPCQSKAEWLTALDEALQPLRLDRGAQLRRVEAHHEGDIHSWGDVTLCGADGEIWLEALDVPLKPCKGKQKYRKD